MSRNKVKWEFLLFVSKKTPKTEYEIELLKKIGEEYLDGRYSIEVIDVITDPETTIKENIIATPALLKKFPEPSRRIIGDLSDKMKLLAALDILSGE